jgi:hypothetical protein
VFPHWREGLTAVRALLLLEIHRRRVSLELMPLLNLIPQYEIQSRLYEVLPFHVVKRSRTSAFYDGLRKRQRTANEERFLHKSAVRT